MGNSERRIDKMIDYRQDYFADNMIRLEKLAEKASRVEKSVRADKVSAKR